MDNQLKTPEEIQNLKDSWRSDPIWDIEHTEGFEAHFDELQTYRIDTEKQWELKLHSRFLKKAEQMGLSENLSLAQYIVLLENKIDVCMKKIENLEANNCND